MRCWPSSERTTNPSSRRKRQDSLSLSLVLFPPKPLRWVSAGALLGEVIKLPFCIFRHFCVGGITTLGVRFMLSKRWTPAGHGGLFAVFMPPQCSPCVGRISTAGTHATPTPNRAHSGSHAETRGGFPARDIGRVDRVNSLGILRIVTFGTAQLNEPLAVAAAHHGGNADFA